VGIDQSEEYVGYARKRLEHALAAPKDEPVLAESEESPEMVLFDVSKVADPNRSSRVMTQTDAFGRPRVARKYNGKKIKDSRRTIAR
jgi:hypothetical protein